MTTTEISDLTYYSYENGTTYEEEVIKIINSFEYNIKKKIYIELWDEKKFRKYFKFGNKILVNPLTLKKDKVNAWFNTTEKQHEIALCMNKNWKKLLLHELMHCRQAENVGVCWHMLQDIYKDKRIEDPFEFHAEYYAVNKIKKEKL